MSIQEGSIDQKEGLQNLIKMVWIIYWLSIASAVLSIIPAANMLSFPVWIVSLALAFVKRSDAKETIYASHISNIITISIVGLIALIILLLFVAVIPLAGLVIGSIGGIIVFIWQVYRLIKGMLRMNDKKAFS